MLKSEKLEAFLLRSGKNIILKVLENVVRQKMEIKCIRLRRKKKKLSLFINDTIIYVEYIIQLTKNLLVLRSNNSKVVEFKINKQKSIFFLYTSNEHVEFESKNIIPFTVLLPKVKYLGINLTYIYI